ncbi:hypothetical protein LEMLEM_LOCUS16527, partial [Lemmus lemmus]
GTVCKSGELCAESYCGKTSGGVGAADPLSLLTGSLPTQNTEAGNPTEGSLGYRLFKRLPGNPYPRKMEWTGFPSLSTLRRQLEHLKMLASAGSLERA